MLFGPHMFNFKDITKALLEHKAAIQVTDEAGLFENVKSLLRDKSKRDAVGRSAKQVALANRGATERNLKSIAEIMR